MTKMRGKSLYESHLRRRHQTVSTSMANNMIVQEVIELINEYIHRFYGINEVPQPIVGLRDGLIQALPNGQHIVNRFRQHIPEDYPIDYLRGRIHFLLGMLRTDANNAPNVGHNQLIINTIVENGVNEFAPIIPAVADPPAPPPSLTSESPHSESDSESEPLSR